MLSLKNNKNNTARHPGALWVLSLTYAVFMWVFGTLIASLTLYLQSMWHMDTRMAYHVFSSYAALLFTLPVLGGYVAINMGYGKGCVAGWVMALCGVLCLCVNTIGACYLGLSLFLLGNALLTPSLWCLVEQLYAKEDPLRVSGITLFYLLFNVGAVLGIFIGGGIAHRYGYRVGMASSAVLLCGGGVVGYLMRRAMPASLLNSTTAGRHSVRCWPRYAMALALVLAVPVVCFLLTHVAYNQWVMVVLGCVALLYMLRLARQQPSPRERNNVYAFLGLSVLAMAFWVLYNLEPSLLSVFISDHVNRDLFGIVIPADAFFGFEGFFVIVVGLLLSRVWPMLDKRQCKPRLSTQFALGLMWMGAGFLFLKALMVYFGTAHELPLLLMVLCYAFFATGELFVGPIGIAMVGELSPKGYEGVFMGVWQLVVGLAAMCSDFLANITVPTTATPTIDSDYLYQQLFSTVGVVSVVLGVAFILLLAGVRHHRRSKESPSLPA